MRANDCIESLFPFQLYFVVERHIFVLREWFGGASNIAE
jgi:hypothetical protein